ncbi:MAG: leucyl/phenylalanyl-tRNA--protein transferase [Rhizomicrobium sp.]
MVEITPDMLLTAYACGLFPMGEHRDDPTLFWLSPDLRGVMPIDGFHVPKRLARTVRANKFRVTADTCFEAVMRACAAPIPDRPGREDSWINERIITLYKGLFDLGHAHSIEAWQGGALVGGLYGVSLGGAFFGESMFSLTTDASKVALVHLIARLKRGGFMLLDTQFLTRHLAQFGTEEVPRPRYLQELEQALAADAIWPEQIPNYCPASSGRSGIFSSAPLLGDTGTAGLTDGAWDGTVVMHLITQTS